MNKIAGYLFLFAVLILSACNPKSTKVITESEPEVKAVLPVKVVEEPVEAYVLTSIKTTACYGKCPVYEAMLYSDGKVVWVGKKFTEREGRFHATVTQAIINELIIEAKSKGVYAMENSYPTERKMYIKDLPNTIISISNGTLPKIITINHGAPKDLMEYQNYLIAFFEGLDWMVVN